MIRTLFLVLWVISFLQPPVFGAIEIYANGHKFDSLQAYQVSKRSVAVSSASTPASLNSQQEDYIQKVAQQLGINVDLSKIKTLQVNRGNLTDATRHKLYVLSVENGVVGALQDFYQTWGQSGILITRRISPKQLQDVIQEAVSTSNSPKLLISEPGKVRIMALTTEGSNK